MNPRDSFNPRKGFVHSPFRYNGHQAYALGSLMSFMPKHTFFIEPFCGGGGVFFAKPKSKYNWLNDVNYELVAVYKTMRDNPLALFRFFSETQSERKYRSLRDELTSVDEIDIAARWFYLNRMSQFRSMGKRWEMDNSITLNLRSLEKLVSTCSTKLQGVNITCGDFEEAIDSAPDASFIFISPPYSFGNSPKKTKSYTFPFLKEDHVRLLDALRRNSKRIKFLLTYPNDKKIREMYSWSKKILTLNSDCTFIGDTTKKPEEEIKGEGGREEIVIKNY